MIFPFYPLRLTLLPTGYYLLRYHPVTRPGIPGLTLLIRLFVAPTVAVAVSSPRRLTLVTFRYVVWLVIAALRYRLVYLPHTHTLPDPFTLVHFTFLTLRLVLPHHRACIRLFVGLLLVGYALLPYRVPAPLRARYTTTQFGLVRYSRRIAAAHLPYLYLPLPS